MRVAFAKIVSLIHLASVGFVLFGWAAPLETVLYVHLAFIPLLIVQWKFNDETCLLTNLENYLLDTKKSKSEQDGEFTKKLLSLCMDPLPPDKAIDRGLYTVIWSSWLVSLIRLSFSFG